MHLKKRLLVSDDNLKLSCEVELRVVHKTALTNSCGKSICIKQLTKIYYLLCRVFKKSGILQVS